MQADETGDGMIDIDEFERVMSFASMKNYLSILELDVDETRNMFNLLDDGDGQISFEEFVKGVMRLKGGARSQDVIAVMHGNQKILDYLHHLVSILPAVVNQ